MVRIDNYRPFDADRPIRGGRRRRPRATATDHFAGARRAGDRDGQRRSAEPARRSASRRGDDAVAGRAPRERPGRRGRGVAHVARTAPAVLWAKAVVDLNNPRRAVLCNWSRDDFFVRASTHSIPVNEAGDAFFGQGWMAVELINEGGHMRRTDRPRRRDHGADRSATPDSCPDSCARAWDGRGASRSRGRERTRAAPRVIAHVWTDFEWDVPPDAWRAGLNRVTFESGDPAVPVGIAISRVSFDLIN